LANDFDDNDDDDDDDDDDDYEVKRKLLLLVQFDVSNAKSFLFSLLRLFIFSNEGRNKLN
jgi:hypothetical protein